MQQKKINPWSIVAVLSAIGFCPLFTLAAILFGIRAIVDIKAKGDTRGVRLAWFAILFGSLITGLWGGGMLWWNTNVRNQIEQGPIHAIIQGQEGKISLFEDTFSNPATNEETKEFLAKIDKRYGALLSGNLNQEHDEVKEESDNLFLGMVPVQATLEYILQFSNKENVRLTAKFELFEQDNGSSSFKNRFVWFQIDDEIEGNLVYPANEVDIVPDGK
jgi:glucose dehydrogenase